METNKTRIDDPACSTCMTAGQQDHRADLTDVTFLVPLRIDLPEQKENAETIIKYTFQHFNTSLIVLEADATRKFFPENEFEGFQYIFIEDTNEIFHRTKLINRLISMARTPYVAVWDLHTIVLPEQVGYALDVLRAKKAIMSLPHNSKYYDCDKISSDLFKMTLNPRLLQKRMPVMQLINSFYYGGEVFLVNREQYENTGGENENIYGSGLEYSERIKRMETLNLFVSFTTESSFRLTCPNLVNPSASNSSSEIKNMKEFLRTCSITY